MTEVSFYHLERSAVEAALPKILEKALAAGHRSVVLTGSDERLAALNSALWTYDQNSFLPHGGAEDGRATDQPIYLTTNEENPNGATVLALVDGVAGVDVTGFERVLDLFDGHDNQAVEAARARWKILKEAGHDLKYWQQTEAGGWQQKA